MLLNFDSSIRVLFNKFIHYVSVSVSSSTVTPQSNNDSSVFPSETANITNTPTVPNYSSIIIGATVAIFLLIISIIICTTTGIVILLWRRKNNILPMENGFTDQSIVNKSEFH